MCHLNHAFVDGAEFSGSIPDDAWTVRTSVPDHVHPTDQWRQALDDITRDGLRTLDNPERFDPEIVLFADALPVGEQTLTMTAPDGTQRWTRFDSAQLPILTRWFLHDPDLQVAAYALPATSRPEGHHAAATAGTLIHLAAGESRTFTVTTGVQR